MYISLIRRNYDKKITVDYFIFDISLLDDIFILYNTIISIPEETGGDGSSTQSDMSSNKESEAIRDTENTLESDIKPETDSNSTSKPDDDSNSASKPDDDSNSTPEENPDSGLNPTPTPEPEPPSGNSKVTVSAVIVNKNGAKGVLTFTSDDGDQRTADFFYTKVSPKYNWFKVTIALPTDTVATVGKTSDGKNYAMNSSGGYSMKEFLSNNYTPMSGSVLSKTTYPKMTDFWKKVTDTGAIEIASHSHTHGPWPDTDNLVYQNNSTTVLWPKGTPTMELRASAQIIRNALKQETPFIMRPGGNFMTTEVSTYFKSLFATDTTYLGMRSSNGAPPFKGATTTSDAKLNTVKKFTTQEGRLTIATILVRGYEAGYDSTGKAFATNKDSTKQEVLNAGISAWEQYVDYAMEYGQWASLGFHSVVADSKTASGYEVYDSQVMALMEYVEPYVESGDLWVAHFSDAAKYYFEWSSASVSAECYNNEYISVTLTDKESDSRFDEALTVKVEVPSEWKTANLTTDGKTTALTIHTDDDGSHFVYANIVPSSNISTIKP